MRWWMNCGRDLLRVSANLTRSRLAQWRGRYVVIRCFMGLPRGSLK
jgi:hypothetical protein